jgi:uncharacterized protein
MKRIADTGLIVGLLTRNDPYHTWAVAEFRAHAPFYVCDAVLVEAGSFFQDPTSVLRLVERGDLILDDAFSLVAELPAVLALAAKYADRPMDIADACLVRMTELTSRCKVWTVDRSDFSSYRRHGKQDIPCVFPTD